VFFLICVVKEKSWVIGARMVVIDAAVCGGLFSYHGNLDVSAPLLLTMAATLIARSHDRDESAIWHKYQIQTALQYQLLTDELKHG
jgi:hypothetical protein